MITHMAMLMGAAKILQKWRENLRAKVFKFHFQPAEEVLQQARKVGAEMMVKEGVLKNP